MAVITRLCHTKAKSRDSPLSWIALLASTLIAVCSVGFINIFSICFNALLKKFGESKEKTGTEAFIFQLYIIIRMIIIIIYFQRICRNLNGSDEREDRQEK